MKEQLNVLMMNLLQENEGEEHQRGGWSMEEKFRWLVMKQFEKKLREILKSMKHKLNIWMKKEELIGVEFRQISFCEPEKGDIPIGEDEENGFLLKVS